ncbi:hypothetical protein [Hydrogenophaga sp. BPS33]|uniref:hypothetical protein n=1 Tax=Hydrogenophaga sp. BPS33 TaxID=2651974 RepID=UPI0013204A31|nr:hypothetical protein [Hydrogenophaga sp. BPS33]QHE89192.1 hypothetical protein F9K07_29840 [Hydrogenophaga sp. BPS33]
MNSIAFFIGGVKSIGRLPAQVSRDARFGTLPHVSSEGVGLQEPGCFASRVWREVMTSMRESTFSPAALAPGYFRWGYLLKSGVQEPHQQARTKQSRSTPPTTTFFGLEAHEAVGD